MNPQPQHSNTADNAQAANRRLPPGTRIHSPFAPDTAHDIQIPITNHLGNTWTSAEHVYLYILNNEYVRDALYLEAIRRYRDSRQPAYFCHPLLPFSIRLFYHYSDDQFWDEVYGDLQYFYQYYAAYL
jgi:hypothetical protein